MNVLRETSNVDWLIQPNQCFEVVTDLLPPRNLTTTAFVLAFHNGKLMLSNLYRGWDTPGGHIEEGECVEEAAQREIFEEACISIHPMTVLGYQKLRVNAEKPANYRYPHPESYQVHFFAEIKHFHAFEATEETQGRRLFSFNELKSLKNLHARIELIQEGFKRHLNSSRYTSMGKNTL